MSKPRIRQLSTFVSVSPQGKPWDVYPRPQLRRKDYVNLNGDWDFTVTHSDNVPHEYDRRVNVPFPVESELSGIGEHFPEGSRLWYSRSFIVSEKMRSGRILLHLDGIDREAVLWINGVRFPEKENERYCTCLNGPETVDITSELQDENSLVICVTDDLNDKSFPYGKQSLNRGGMWYTPVSGIWQTVWLESVPEEYIHGLKITPVAGGADIEVIGAECGVVSCDGKDYQFTNGRLRIEPNNPKLWTPDNPHLYDFTVKAGEDEAQSYFALRTVEIREAGGIPRICLNGKPYFFHGLLDQGYWPDGIYTPPSPQCYADDIIAMKELGFNTLRKHIKVEPGQFYYECDRLGMIVFQDMVNNGDYSFLRDTALPTFGLQKIKDDRMNRDETCRNRFIRAMEQTVRTLYNHPCICYWTIFNEGWGQFDSSKQYDRLKRIDSTRVVDSTSGWFRTGKTDVDSRHVYFRKFKMPKSDRPIVLSEFGGYVYKDAEHSFNPDKAYGYRYFKTREDFIKALEMLYRTEIIPAVKKGLCAAIYTQVSDVEDETNGLITYDRCLCKADAERMKAIAVSIQREI